MSRAARRGGRCECLMDRWMDGWMGYIGWYGSCGFLLGSRTVYIVLFFPFISFLLASHRMHFASLNNLTSPNHLSSILKKKSVNWALILICCPPVSLFWFRLVTFDSIPFHQTPAPLAGRDKLAYSYLFFHLDPNHFRPSSDMPAVLCPRFARGIRARSNLRFASSPC